MKRDGEAVKRGRGEATVDSKRCGDEMKQDAREKTEERREWGGEERWRVQ